MQERIKRGVGRCFFFVSGTQNSSFVYLSILATFIIGGDDKKELPLELACMVFDFPKFEKYPWGRVAFKKLIASVKRANLNANSYTLDEFVQVLQV